MKRGALIWLLTAAAAHAQATKIFVSSVGNDAADGSRISPKRTFQAAHDAVAARVQIVPLDTAGYGGLAINKSVSVTTPPGVNAFVTTTGTATPVTIAAGENDLVSFRGLIIVGPGATVDGILAGKVGELRVDECTISNCGSAIEFLGSTPAHLLVTGGALRDCTVGVAVESQAAGVTLDAVVTGCSIQGMSLTGLIAQSLAAGANARITASRCLVSQCGQGLASANAAAIVLADNCALESNTTAIVGVNGGTVVSFGNNTLVNNTANGTFSSVRSPQ